MTTSRLAAILSLAIALLLPQSLASQKLPDTMTGSCHPAIRTLRVRSLDETHAVESSCPVITLDSNEKLIITFDELAEDRSYMRYELIHCNALWMPDNLVDTEFLDGFNQAEVDDYEFSRATLVHYVNYRIVIPNEQMSPLISGNYLLRVYPEDDPDATLLQVRFSVSENSALIGATVTSRTDFDYNNRHQQLSINVDAEHLNLNDIYNDITIVVEQNGRTDNATVITHPMSVSGSTARYEHNPALLFEAGNEYRRFETISDYYPGRGVDKIIFADPLYHIDLYPDRPRANARYEYDLAQRGEYVVRRQDANDSDTEADYVVVHFSLEAPEDPSHNIYIEGDLTDRRLNPESMMTYNHDAGRYEKALLLKQGAYSYQYLALPARGGKGETGVIEGDYYPTRNRYTVKVYYRLPGERYDRLAGVTQIDNN